MKKLSALIVFCFLLCLCSCSQATEKQTLQDMINLDKSVFSLRNTEIDVYNGEDIYRFSNKYDRVPEDFYNSLNQYEVEVVTEKENAYNHIYINFRFNNPYSDTISLNIDEKNQIILNYDYDKVYKCEGIYDALQEYFKPIFSESNFAYMVGSTPVFNQYEYVIFDKNHNLIKNDTLRSQPHITKISDDEVCLWVQAGTGIYTRWSIYYNRVTGEVSPTYNGQTDSYGNLTCNTGSGKVIVSDIFSGQELYVIDKFNEPLADYFENIVSAYFTEDGTQIKVVYKNQSNEDCEQVFDLPQNISAQ